jgi:hypothetical protein
MNNSTAFNTTSYLTKDQIFELYGSTIIKDGIVFFALMPLSIIGIIFNSISLIVFYKEKFSSITLYDYLKVYTWNSIFINLVQLLVVSGQSFRFLSLSYSSKLPGYYMAYVYIPGLNILILFGVLLEVCIVIERISQFSTGFKYILKFKVRNLCLAFFVFSFVLNIQNFFAGRPSTNQHQLNSTTFINISYFRVTKFSRSLTWAITNGVVFSFRDMILLILQLILNIKSINLLRKHIRNKKEILERSIKKCLLKEEGEKNIVRTRQFKINGLVTKQDQNLIIMTVFMTFITILEHLFFLLMISLITIYENSFAFFIASLANLFIAFKYSSNFFIFFIFNKNFRLEFKNLILNKSEYSKK